MNIFRYLNLAFALGFIWEMMKQTRATDPDTQNDEYQAVAEQVLARPKIQRTLEAMTPEDAEKTRAGLPGALRILDALTE